MRTVRLIPVLLVLLTGCATTHAPAGSVEARPAGSPAFTPLSEWRTHDDREYDGDVDLRWVLVDEQVCLETRSKLYGGFRVSSKDCSFGSDRGVAERVPPMEIVSDWYRAGTDHHLRTVEIGERRCTETRSRSYGGFASVSIDCGGPAPTPSANPET